MENCVFSSSFNTPNVVSGFCHFGLVFFTVLWQSPDTPVMSCFHVSVLEPCALSSACLVSCSDPGTRVLSFGFVPGFRHSRSVFCLVVWACGLESCTLSSACFVSCWSVVFGSRHSCLEFRFRVGVQTLALHVLSCCVSVRSQVCSAVRSSVYTVCVFIGVIVISSPSLLLCVVFCLALPSRVASLVSPTVCFVYLY